jgi:hypothetical protein
MISFILVSPTNKTDRQDTIIVEIGVKHPNPLNLYVFSLVLVTFQKKIRGITSMRLYIFRECTKGLLVKKIGVPEETPPTCYNSLTLVITQGCI